MRVTFYGSMSKKFDKQIAECLQRGIQRCGDLCELVGTEDFKKLPKGVDCAVVVGVKANSGPIFHRYRKAGRHAVFIDKGYTRIRGGPLGTLYWRISGNAFQPLHYFQKTPRPSDRWRWSETDIRDRRVPGGQEVLFAGSSQKFCDFHKLGNATEYATAVLREARKHTDRPLAYRPKPSWGDAVPIEGVRYSHPKEKFVGALDLAHVVVTYGSNACLEAMLFGVPAVVLGDGITRPLCSTSLADLDKPRFPTRDQLYQLACDLAYCQWTLSEFASGDAWKVLRPCLDIEVPA
jgi:hypothetical protein